MLPKGFKLAAKMKFPKKLKKRIKVYISPYSTEFDNIFVVGPIWKNSPRVNFPCSTRSRKNLILSI
jgi:hypothetical protein